MTAHWCCAGGRLQASLGHVGSIAVGTLPSLEGLTARGGIYLAGERLHVVGDAHRDLGSSVIIVPAWGRRAACFVSCVAFRFRMNALSMSVFRFAISSIWRGRPSGLGTFCFC